MCDIDSDADDFVDELVEPEETKHEEEDGE